MSDAKMTLDELVERLTSCTGAIVEIGHGVATFRGYHYEPDQFAAFLRSLTQSIPVPQAELPVREVRKLLGQAESILKTWPLGVRLWADGSGIVLNRDSVEQVGTHFTNESEMLTTLTRLATPPKPPKPATVTITIPFEVAVKVAKCLDGDIKLACREAVKEWAE